jgi:porin
MRSVVLFLLLSLVCTGPVSAQDIESSDTSTVSGSTENPGGTEDDDYSHEETLPHKSGYGKRPYFGSKSSVEAQLEEDDRLKEPIIRFPSIDRGLKSWFDRKKEWNETLGFKLGMDYNTTFQSTDDSLTSEDRFLSGTARIYGTWELYNKGQPNKGSLVFQFNHRHNIHYPLSPAGLAGAVGYAGVTALNFNDSGALLGDLYWKQNWADGNGGFVAGRFDPNDYMDVLGYVNPYTTFTNLSVLLNESIALPDWSWGIGVGRWFGEQIYVSASLSDANGNATNESWFEGGSEFFTQAEIGWSPSKADRYFKHIHLTVWHADERFDAGVPSSDGVAIGANWSWNKTWMAFARAGWSDGGAPISNEAYTIGFGKLFRSWSDVLGAGINWGDPAFPTPEDQQTTEIFYRMQFSENLQITPSIQFLKDPALNPDNDSVRIFGIRMRLTL